MSVTDVTSRFPIALKWPRLVMHPSEVDAIVIHHTAVDPRGGGEALLLPAASMTVEDELNHIGVIHLYHKSQGFGGFGYHIIVFPSGRAYLVTPLSQWGAHVGGENDHLWGIVFAGDFTDRLPGEPQIEGGRGSVSYCGDLPINPHLAYGGTTCPGRVVEILDQLKEDDMDDARVEEIVRAMEFRPAGHRGATLDQWVASYHSHRKHPNVAAIRTLHTTNRSYRRRVGRLAGKAIGLFYQWTKPLALDELDSVIAEAKDLKAKIEGGKTVP